MNVTAVKCLLALGSVVVALAVGAVHALVSPPTPADVVRVVDGDTVDARFDGKVQRLRLIGMDSPEVVDPRKPVECFGRNASLHTTSTLRIDADGKAL